MFTPRVLLKSTLDVDVLTMIPGGLIVYFAWMSFRSATSLRNFMHCPEDTSPDASREVTHPGPRFKQKACSEEEVTVMYSSTDQSTGTSRASALSRSGAALGDRGALLALGAALLVASQMRAGVGLLAWIAPVPWLRYLRVSEGWRSRLLFGAVVIVAWSVATLKLVTAPLPLAFALLGVGLGAFALTGFLVWDFTRNRTGSGVALLVFPASMAVLEWVQAHATPLATWGAAVYTQVDNLAFLQIASVVGGAGAGFFVNWVAAGVESFWAANDRPRKRHDRYPHRVVLVPLICVALVHVWGTWRSQRPMNSESAIAATVDTTANFGASPVLPDATERSRIIATLLDDTRRAARAGARLVVWTEAAALALPGEEREILARAAETAARERITLVTAYIVPRRMQPLRYENKLVWITPNGTIDHEYLKHRPVPGEPAVVGTSAPRVVSTDLGRASGAICYDYDYPSTALAHGRLNVDLVALPSSDWRGIDPLHTQMASVRAIEAGVSIVRSTRFGLSAGIDPHGRLHSWRSSFDGADRIMLVTLPHKRLGTLYTHIGDLPVAACLLFVLAVLSVYRRTTYCA